MGWIPMVRRSILSSFREKQLAGAEEAQSSPGAVNELTKPVKPSRQAKLHIGGYFDPDDRTIVAFQKLKVDLRKSQQEMLLEALQDFVAKQEAAQAFR